VFIVISGNILTASVERKPSGKFELSYKKIILYK
jgi:hypothetical protein